MIGCAVHHGIVKVGLTCNTISPMPPSLLSVKGTSKLRPHGREHPEPRTGLHPWLCRAWKILPKTMGYCSNTIWARRLWFEDNNARFAHVQPHSYRLWHVEPSHRWGEVVSNWARGSMPKQQKQLAPHIRHRLQRSPPRVDPTETQFSASSVRISTHVPFHE